MDIVRGGATFWCLLELRALHINSSHPPNFSLSRNPKEKRELKHDQTQPLILYCLLRSSLQVPNPKMA